MTEVRRHTTESVLTATPSRSRGQAVGEILSAPSVSDWSESEALIGAMRALHSTLNLNELYEIVVKVIASLTGSAGAVLLLHRPRTHHPIVFRAWLHEWETSLPLPAQAGDQLIGWLNDRANTHEPFDAPPREVADAILEVLKTPIRGEQWVPLVTPQRVIGAIGALTTASDPGRRLPALFVPLAEQATAALSNALLYRRVERQSLETQTLLAASRTLMSSRDLDQVLHAILDTLHRVLPYNAAGVFLVGDGGHVERIIDRGYEGPSDDSTVPLERKARKGLVGWVAAHGQPLIVNNVADDARYQRARTQTRSEMVVPIFAGERLVGVFNLERDSVDGFLEADLDIVTAFAQHAGVAVERARAEAVSDEKRRMEGELEVARRIQRTFLPDASPNVPGFDIAGVNIPSEQVGGDYYDFLPIVKDQLGIAIADVSGKGIPAALIMASLRASLIAEIRNQYALRRIIEKVNLLMCERNDEGRFVTAIYGVLDSRNRIFTFCNAGHNPGILRRADGSIVMLSDGGLALGILDDAQFVERAVGLNAGDVILLYTDGVTDVIGADGSMFDTERLLAALHRHAHLSSQQIIDAVRRELQEFADPGAPVDDLTLVCVKVLEPQI